MRRKQKPRGRIECPKCGEKVNRTDRGRCQNCGCLLPIQNHKGGKY